MDLKSLAKSILEGTVADLGDVWRNLPAEDQQLVRDVATDAAKVALKAALQQDVALEKIHVEAQLSNLKAVASQRVAESLWESASKALSLAAGVLVRR